MTTSMKTALASADVHPKRFTMVYGPAGCGCRAPVAQSVESC
ncbi:hypothetical protein [Rhodococcus qingshengii]|nr:hypothetical protein [Rhodococcus qingshengii]